MQSADAVLTWLHFGDLHITEADQQNAHDMRALVETARRHLAGRVDFAVLPGDNADQGTEAQFRLVRDAMDGLSMPLHILPGDHDFHGGDLEAFHDVLGADPLPKSLVAKGARCLFLDVVSAGGGGPDFRIDAPQFDWLERELAQATEHAQPCALFMHAYPADLHEGAERLTRLLARHQVVSVDMGHTHYNELANDGHTVFMSTRSTGQIEEGPVGFSLAALDGGVVSWRFQPLSADWPIVLITSPSDYRLIIDPGSPDQVVRDRVRIAARVLGEGPISGVTASIDGDAPFALARVEGDPAQWQAQIAAPAAGLRRVAVSATESGGGIATETIVMLVSPDGHYEPPSRHADGSDRDSVGAWPEKHLFGTQLGPNRFGRKW